MAKRICDDPDCADRHYAHGWCAFHYRKKKKAGLITPRPPLSLEDRFWAKVNKAGPIPEGRPELGNCWDWTGRPNEEGYGSLLVGGRKGKQERAHRVGYELVVGPIPAGLVLDHLCRRTSCVRYSHLDPCTQAVNIARGKAPAALGEANRQRRERTHCKHGHEFTAANTTIRHNGCRTCKACARERAAKLRERPGYREQMAAWNRAYRRLQRTARLDQAS